MGSNLSVNESVQVVIIGGGFAGKAAASQLKSNGIPFILVDIKEAFHHNVAALRASVEAGFARKTFISYEESFQNSFKQGRVSGINLQKQLVVLENNEEIHYSHLIIATGSDGPFPGKFNKATTKEKAIQVYEDLVKEVQKAKHVVVVGGGVAGVEMAAEVKTDYPEKEVTLIHSKTALADVELLPHVRETIKEILLEKGVKLVLGDKVSSNGALKVNDYLQVEGYNNIYAVGDCADLSEPKMAYHAGLHAKIAVTNIIHSLKEKPLKTYKTGPVTMLVSMGRNDGVGQFNGYYIGRCLVTVVKSKDVLVTKSWKDMGQKMPK
ncbi:ferroptosis suppressor protein 1 isoform X2 [Ranitomeya variabilis]|uniref:ferroptosis suppressor protein 1 isoform X2 n=1 Tax=Ranitomeya variabilis TaxID=490064 RepID=UPI0040569E3D